MHAQDPRYQHKRLTAAGVVSSNPSSVRKLVLVNAGTPIDGLVELYDAGSATGDPVLDLEIAAEQGTVEIDLHDVGGLRFPNTGIYADLTGAGLIVHIWYD